MDSDDLCYGYEDADEDHPDPMVRAYHYLVNLGCPLPVDLYIELQEAGIDPDKLNDNLIEGKFE